MERQKTIQESIEMVCGIAVTLTEDASSILSSQCLFIGEFRPSSDFEADFHETAGMFMQDARQRGCILELLDSCRDRCGWPSLSLGSDLEQLWANPKALWGVARA